MENNKLITEMLALVEYFQYERKLSVLQSGFVCEHYLKAYEQFLKEELQ